MDIYSEKLLKENNLLKSKIQEISFSIELLKKKIEIEKEKRVVNNTNLSTSITSDNYGNKD